MQEPTDVSEESHISISSILNMEAVGYSETQYFFTKIHEILCQNTAIFVFTAEITSSFTNIYMYINLR